MEPLNDCHLCLGAIWGFLDLLAIPIQFWGDSSAQILIIHKLHNYYLTNIKGNTMHKYSMLLSYIWDTSSSKSLKLPSYPFFVKFKYVVQYKYYLRRLSRHYDILKWSARGLVLPSRFFFYYYF